MRCRHLSNSPVSIPKKPMPSWSGAKQCSGPWIFVDFWKPTITRRFSSQPPAAIFAQRNDVLVKFFASNRGVIAKWCQSDVKVMSKWCQSDVAILFLLIADSFPKSWMLQPEMTNSWHQQILEVTPPENGDLRSFQSTSLMTWWWPKCTVNSHGIAAGDPQGRSVKNRFQLDMKPPS